MNIELTAARYVSKRMKIKLNPSWYPKLDYFKDIIQATPLHPQLSSTLKPVSFPLGGVNFRMPKTKLSIP